MKQPYLIALSFLLSMGMAGQALQDFYDFETVTTNTTEWSEFGEGRYSTGIDSTVSYSSTKSAFIFSENADVRFKALSYELPAVKDGKKIKLSAWIKTEGVKNGWAGVWLRLDPNAGFDNMQNQSLTGTNDWKEYHVELKLKPDQTERIVFGGILAGEGKMWLDNLTVTIDGKPYNEAPAKVLSGAAKDTAFDEGSGIELTDLSEQQIENAEILGKVWGLMKYHHPAASKGELNWDYELFRTLELVINASDNTTRDQLLVDWIASYGKIPECKRCKSSAENYPVKPDHSWINSSELSIELQNKLQYIIDNRYQGRHHYIDVMPGVGNPEFKNERSYSEMTYPDAGFRLLALYRYWNMIHYYFPYKADADKDWNTVLKEYIPRFVDAKDELAYEIAALQIIGDIQDTHANLWGGGDKFRETKGANFPPVRVKFIEDKLVVVDYFNPEKKTAVGLEIGDVITSINGKSVDKIVAEKSPYYPASNEAARLRDIAIDILKSDTKESNVSVQSASGSKNLKIPLFERDSLNIYNWYRVNKEAKCHKMLDNNIGYVSLANIQPEDLDDIQDQYRETKGMIIDIRNYPSTFVVFSLGRYFAQGRNEFVKFTKPDLDMPGAFDFTNPLSVGVKKSDKNTYDGTVVVLINELSQSQAEYTTMAFRGSPNTKVLGSTTAGADGNVSTIYLPGGLRTMISGIGVYYPDGKPTQRIGIVPDIYLEPTIEGIRSGKDELLEKAKEVILKN